MLHITLHKEDLVARVPTLLSRRNPWDAGPGAESGDEMKREDR